MTKLLLLLCIFNLSLAFGQTPIGTPFIKNFAKKTYTAATQNWKGVCNESGMVFFANNSGLLAFDGQTWQIFPQEKHSLLRAIALDTSGIIYAGGQNEIGFFAPNSQGKWTYNNLTDKIPESDRNFDDVWAIVIHESGVFFRAKKKIFQYYNEKFTIITPQDYFNFIGILDGAVVAQDGFENLYSLTGKKQSFQVPEKDLITSIIPLNKNQDLITTLNNGFFLHEEHKIVRWHAEDLNFFKKNDTYSASLLGDGNIAVGTLLGGFSILSPSGKTIMRINRETELQNNSILCSFQDNNKNIWLGLDNGISLIDYNSPFTFFTPDANSESTGYSTISNHKNIYFGTSIGLYSLGLDNPTQFQSFKRVPNATGQIRNINVIGQNIVVSRHKNAQKITSNGAISISAKPGSWLFQPLQKDSNFVLSGTYHGLCLYDKNLNFIRKLKGFEESSRFLEQDHLGNIWVAHPNKGIYKINLSDSLNLVTFVKYGQKDGLPSNLLNHVFKIGQKLLFPTIDGIYSFDADKNQFEPNPNFNKLLKGRGRIRRLIDIPNGDIWYISSKEIGKLMIKENRISKQINAIHLPQVSDYLVEGFESLYPIGDDAILAAEKGFIYFNSQKEWSKNVNFGIVLADVSLTNHGDSSIFFGHFFEKKLISLQPDSAVPIIPFQENGIRFSFSATKYIRSDKIRYRFKLLGLNDIWSDWTYKHEKEYNNLKGNHYTFIVQAIDEFDTLSTQVSYRFRIIPAWYLSNIAYLLYFIGFGTFLYIAYRLSNKKYEQQKQIALKSEEVVQKSEEIIDQLKSEKLESEIHHKNQELISASLHLAHRNEVFIKVKSDIEKLAKSCSDLKTKANLEAIIKILSTEEDVDASWNEFVTYFNKNNSGFFDKLQEKFPELNQKDLKLCAYIRMNLTTKEIATLSNISVRGVEGARYRLRKKMDLDAAVKLVTFLKNEF